MPARPAVCALAFGFILTAGSGPAAAGFIVNGTFEVYSPFFANPGSPVTNGGWTFANFAGVEAGVGSPGQAVRLESNGLTTSDPTITQTVTGLTVGTTYTLSWDLALRVNFAGAGTGRSFGAFLDSQAFANALFLGEHLSTTYTSQSVAFVATAASHTFIFAGELDNRTNGGVGNTDVSYRIDNIDLTPTAAVPAPPSLALSAVGGAVLAASRLRRRFGRRDRRPRSAAEDDSPSGGL
jgi:hypothetical protein